TPVLFHTGRGGQGRDPALVTGGWRGGGHHHRDHALLRNSPGPGTLVPSSAYWLSLLRRVRMEMPRMLAACVRLPSTWSSVSRIRSRSTSATVRPTRVRDMVSAT